MKIAYLINQYPQPSQSFIRRELAAIEREGVSVSRFTLRRYKGPLPDFADQSEQERTTSVLEQGPAVLFMSILWALSTRPAKTFCALYTAIRSDWEPRRGLFLRIAYFAEACFLSRRLLGEKIDHLHAHFGTNSTAVALLTRLLGGPPYSFTCHGPEEFDRSDTLGLGAKVHHAAFAVAISDFGRSQLYRWADPADWNKIQIVHCGVEEAFLGIALTPVPSTQRFVCIGRLSEQKGQLSLVEASAIVVRHFPQVEILLVGDGPMRPDIESAISRLGLKKNVRLLGWKTGEEIRELILSSRAMVLASFAEGLPVVIMESLALNRPVISTGVMGIPELVRSRETGWLVPPANPGALADAMMECLNTDPALLTQMGNAGHKLILERHDPRVEADCLLSLMRKYGQIMTTP